MKAIVDLTKEEHAVLHKTHCDLRSAIDGATRRDLFDELQSSPDYAHYKFHGKYNERLVTLLGRAPTADEIIMLVDGGFSHFGATCTIDHETREFQGRVNTD